MMARPSASFQWFSQAVGRCLRPDLDSMPTAAAMWDTLGAAGRRAAIASSRKPRGMLIDLVGNFTRTYRIGDAEHVGPPELFTGFSLDGRTRKRNVGDAIPTRTCLNCFLPYERYYKACPHCGTAAPVPPVGTAPDIVDGNIYDYDPVMLAQARAEVARIDGPVLVPRELMGTPAGSATHNNWLERQRVQHALREAIALWAGYSAGLSEPELASKFYLTFGVDVVRACALGGTPAESLRARIMEKLA